MGTALREVALNDKYTLTTGRVFITGNQALARLPIIQQQLDARDGLRTSGFISGYRGSPIGGYDATLWELGEELRERGIVFQPGLN